MLRNVAYGGLALVGGAITGIVISSWATPPGPVLQVGPEAVQVASVAQPSMTLASTSSRVANEASNCSPWDVSDVAMEAALNEMIRRGWRPPTQAEAIEAFQPYDGQGAAPLDPNAFVPVRRPPAPASQDASATEAAEPFPVDQILPTSEGAATPALPTNPSPTLAAPEPTPPSN